MNEEEKLNKLSDAIQAIQLTLARLEGKIDGQGEAHRDSKDDIKDHETRLRALEKTKWLMVGAASAAGGAAGALARLLGG